MSNNGIMVEVAEDGTITCPFCKQSGLTKKEFSAHYFIEQWINQKVEIKEVDGERLFKLRDAKAQAQV